jgi:hypothetical protein
MGVVERHIDDVGLLHFGIVVSIHPYDKKLSTNSSKLIMAL